MMRRFRFSLQPVHDLRQLRLDEAEREFGRASQEVAAAAAALAEAGRVRLAATEAYSAALTRGSLDPHEIMLRNDYLTSLALQERESRERLEALARELDRRREAMAAAAREADATGKLRERQLARHRAEADRAEQLNLDDMATLATARRLREAS
jgi:flagellar export protein FliJ